MRHHLKKNLVTKWILINFPIVLIAFLVILYFWRLLFFNFVTDDFFHLRIGQFKNPEEFITLFTFSHSLETSEFIFYRPLTTQVYYGLLSKLFGFNPFPFHLFSLVVHILNTFLVYKLTSFLLRNKYRLFASLAAIFFGLNPSQTIAVGWAGTFQEIGVTFFIILSIFSFLKHLNTRKTVLFLGSFLFFIFALMSKENAMVLPFILLLMIFFFGNRKDLIKLVPFFIILIFYTYFHFIKYSFKQSEGYTFVVNLQALNTLRWHIWWALGFPEPLTNFIGPKFRILPHLWNFYFKEGVILLSLFVVLNLSIIYSILSIIRMGASNIFDKKILFFSLFYLIFLIPILFFPQNKYAYHQVTSLVGMSIILALTLQKLYLLKIKYSQLIIVITVISFLMLSFLSIDFTIKESFIIQRSRYVDNVLIPFLADYPTLPKDSVIYIKNDPNYIIPIEGWGGSALQSYYALYGDNAFKLYYGDDIEVYYEGVNDSLINADDSKIIKYVASLELK